MDKVEALNVAGEDARNSIADLLGVDAQAILVDTALQSAMGRDRMTLYKLSLFFAKEMERCLDAGAYFAGCVAGASANEAILTLLALQFEDRVVLSKAYKGCDKFETYRRTIGEWKFERLISLSDELKWIPSTLLDANLTAAIIEDFPHLAVTVYPEMTPDQVRRQCDAIQKSPGIEIVRLSQRMRNLVHAPKWLKANAKFDERELALNCRLAMIASAEISKCLLAKFAEESAKVLSAIRDVVAGSSPEQLDHLRTSIKDKLGL